MPKYTYQIGQTHHTWTISNHIPDADERGCIQFAPRLQETYRILLEMLAFWTRVAKEHRIRWFAVAGTLLGAVRHQGIIPFDDDIDIGVPIDEYPKLARLSRLELDAVYGIFLTEGCGARVYQRNGVKTPAIDLFLMGLDDSGRRYVYAGPLTSAGKPTYFLSHTFSKEWVEVRDVHPSVRVEVGSIRASEGAHSTPCTHDAMEGVWFRLSDSLRPIPPIAHRPSCDGLGSIAHDLDSLNGTLCSPNEDFGRSDKHFRVRFRSTFQRFVAQIEYSHP